MRYFLAFLAISAVAIFSYLAFDRINTYESNLNAPITTLSSTQVQSQIEWPTIVFCSDKMIAPSSSLSGTLGDNGVYYFNQAQLDLAANDPTAFFSQNNSVLRRFDATSYAEVLDYTGTWSPEIFYCYDLSLDRSAHFCNFVHHLAVAYYGVYSNAGKVNVIADCFIFNGLTTDSLYAKSDLVDFILVSI